MRSTFRRCPAPLELKGRGGIPASGCTGGYSHPSLSEKLPVDGCSPRSGAGSPEHIFARKMLVGGKDPDPNCISFAGHVIAECFLHAKNNT